MTLWYVAKTYSDFQKAWYRLPPGDWESDDRRMTIYGGFVLNSCKFLGTQWVSPTRSVRIYQWSTEYFEGQYYEEQDGKWASHAATYLWVETDFLSQEPDGSWDFNVGDSDADQALEDYFNDNQCTDGWVILVDGERVC